MIDDYLSQYGVCEVDRGEFHKLVTEGLIDNERFRQRIQEWPHYRQCLDVIAATFGPSKSTFDRLVEALEEYASEHNLSDDWLIEQIQGVAA